MTDKKDLLCVNLKNKEKSRGLLLENLYDIRHYYAQAEDNITFAFHGSDFEKNPPPHLIDSFLLPYLPKKP